MGDGARRSLAADGVLVGRTLATQALLLCALPFSLGATVGAVASSVVRPTAVAAPPPGGARTILLTGGKMTKALQLARSFKAAGHRVVLVETAKYRFTGHRFSRAVDAFHTVPESGSADYPTALLDIVRAEAVDVVVPVCSPAASRHDASARTVLDPHCEVVHVGPELLEQLDDKYRFAKAAESLGLPVPETHLVTDPNDVVDFDFEHADRRGKTFVMKSIAYDPIRRLDLTPLPRPTPTETERFVRSLPISTDNPWILQEFVRGQEYCTHGTARHGRLTVYCCCESSAFQINYAAVDKPEIEAWVRRFVEALDITGQVSFDFIETPDGDLRAIECNPRTHSAITMFYDHPGVAAAYLDDDADTIVPTPSSRPTYWLFHEIWRLAVSPDSFRTRWSILRDGKDAIFAVDDPLPFLAVHHLQIPSLLWGNLRRRRGWSRIDFNIGKLVEPGGD